jgi:hypothetical protein
MVDSSHHNRSSALRHIFTLLDRYEFERNSGLFRRPTCTRYDGFSFDVITHNLNSACHDGPLSDRSIARCVRGTELLAP